MDRVRQQRCSFRERCVGELRRSGSSSVIKFNNPAFEFFNHILLIILDNLNVLYTCDSFHVAYTATYYCRAIKSVTL